MGEIIQWRLREDQKDLFEILVVLTLNILFLLIVLLLWPLGRLALVFDLAKGFGILWIVTFAVTVLILRLQCLWPVSGRAFCGWFFRLFEKSP
jgi:hypothetical protein